jgi:hypothetical protein
VYTVTLSFASASAARTPPFSKSSPSVSNTINLRGPFFSIPRCASFKARPTSVPPVGIVRSSIPISASSNAA